MSISLVQSVPQGELQQLLELASNFRSFRQPYVEVLPKTNRKLDYRTGASTSAMEASYLYEEFPALAIGVHVDVSY
jgi:hypothetical protein